MPPWYSRSSGSKYGACGQQQTHCILPGAAQNVKYLMPRQKITNTSPALRSISSPQPAKYCFCVCDSVTLGLIFDLRQLWIQLTRDQSQALYAAATFTPRSWNSCASSQFSNPIASPWEVLVLEVESVRLALEVSGLESESVSRLESSSDEVIQTYLRQSRTEQTEQSITDRANWAPHLPSENRNLHATGDNIRCCLHVCALLCMLWQIVVHSGMHEQLW